ncbi:hypothetical protein [Parvibacter caecicola]|uniref:hypothetical protein n=1 Tax=Parvibacter caecicola TaxID=747645 RepID=UPI00249AC8BA|nr:hypothetical protein [Parvibacter caecicola]
MPKKRARKAPKTGAVWRQTADEATLAQNPRYNGFACGHGAHGEAKYSRAKAKRAWRKQLKQEGASRGSFPFSETWRVRSLLLLSYLAAPSIATFASKHQKLVQLLRVIPQKTVRQGHFAGALAGLVA